MSFKFKSFYTTIFISLFFINISDAQKKSEGNLKRAEEIKKMMWESDEPDFKVVEIPEKWKNESAVIICQRHYHEYQKAALDYLYHKEYFHKRIKLLDKSSVSEYSELSFPSDRSSTYETERFYMGIKIIKQSGNEVVVNMDEVVEMEKNDNGYTSRYKKIAVPSLEQGDVLDYYVGMESEIIPYLKAYAFSNVIYNLQEQYPILKQSLEFKIKRRCYLNIKVYNDAPELKSKEDPQDESTIYYMNDENREKVSEKLWHYPYRSLPTIKFQVYYSTQSNENYFNFIGTAGVPNTTITTGELVKYVNKVIDNNSIGTSIIESYLKKYHKNETDPEKIAQISYDYYRYLNYNRSTLTKFYNQNYASEVDFIRTMSNVLKNKKIPHEILISVPRHISTIDNAVLEAELSMIIKVNTNNPFYISPFGYHSLMKEIESNLQGADAYAIDALTAASKRAAVRLKIPVASYKENRHSQKMNISIYDEDFNTIQANIESTIDGKTKLDEQSNFVYYTDYQAEECRHFNDKPYIETIKKEKVKVEEQKKIDRQIEECNQHREKVLKANADEEFDAKVISIKNFKLKQTGRWVNQPSMIFSQDIEIEGLIKKVGPNYLFEVGKLIGKQIELTEEDKKRKYDIYMPFARSFYNEITFQIPDGFSVEGFESLNIDQQNKTGGFVSTAIINGDKLIITTHKYYVNNFEKAEDWKNIEDFLEAAYSFTQQKVLLKRK